jgi:ADP-heptose:LPS heptosyltransferase
MGIKHWMALVAAADYVVSVDTSTFHCAGGLGRPLTGIFTYIDGLTYSKYYPTAIIVQKHRLLDPSWDCGPCFNWHNCPKCPAQNPIKPCLTDISTAMLVDGIEIMLQNRMTTLA